MVVIVGNEERLSLDASFYTGKVEAFVRHRIG